jgi:hypothetical protein
MGMRIVKNTVITFAAALALLGGIAQSFTLFAAPGMKYHTTPTHVWADGQSLDMKYHT